MRGALPPLTPPLHIIIVFVVYNGWFRATWCEPQPPSENQNLRLEGLEPVEPTCPAYTRRLKSPPNCEINHTMDW